MNFLEKEIHQLISSKNFLKSNLKQTLDQAHNSFNRIKQIGKDNGLDYDEKVEKEILSKCLYETINKLFYEEVRKTVIKEEQTYSK
jgi:hypothetical protein